MKSVFAQQRSAAEKLSARFVGKPLPPIVLHDIDGHDVPLSRYRGHPLLLDFWATWCGGCLNELPALARLRKSTDRTDLKIVGITRTPNPASVQTSSSARDTTGTTFTSTGASPASYLSAAFR